MRTLITFLVVAVLALAVSIVAHGALGQVDAAAAAGQRDTMDLARLAARTEPAVLLARMAWIEAGPHVDAGEIAAMHEVIATRQRGSYQRTAYAYSAGLRNPARSAHRLTRRPLGAGWPRIYREQWPRVLEAASAVVAGTLHHECSGGTLQHWGGPHVDAARLRAMERNAYVRAECPARYANAFMVRLPE